MLSRFLFCSGVLSLVLAGSPGFGQLQPEVDCSNLPGSVSPDQARKHFEGLLAALRAAGSNPVYVDFQGDSGAIIGINLPITAINDDYSAAVLGKLSSWIGQGFVAAEYGLDAEPVQMFESITMHFRRNQVSGLPADFYSLAFSATLSLRNG